MKRNTAFAAAIPLVVALDQATKLLVDATMHLGQSIPVLPGLFNLTYIRNTGIAFGLFNDGQHRTKALILSLISLASLAFLLWLLREFREDDRWGGLALGMVGGGAVGNMVDRVRLGEVIDFLDFYWRGHHWPFFNVADSSITLGVSGLILHQIVASRRQER